MQRNLCMVSIISGTVLVGISIAIGVVINRHKIWKAEERFIEAIRTNGEFQASPSQLCDAVGIRKARDDLREYSTVSSVFALDETGKRFCQICRKSGPVGSDMLALSSINDERGCSIFSLWYWKSPPQSMRITKVVFDRSGLDVYYHSQSSGSSQCSKYRIHWLPDDAPPPGVFNIP